MESQDIFKKTMRNLRRAVNMSGLSESDVNPDPFVQFEDWIKEAVKKEAFEPNAMTLATSDAEGKTTARTVLLKDYGPEGFVFYTNYNSRKAKNLFVNPNASLVFYWGILMRQVLIEGAVTKTDRQTSQDYFHSRPRGSQIAAYVSAQSEEVGSRQELEQAYAKADEEFKGKDIPCPEHWGGFILKPLRMEFWQGRADRLHDRLEYVPDSDGKWVIRRLAP